MINIDWALLGGLAIWVFVLTCGFTLVAGFVLSRTEADCDCEDGC